MPNELICKKHNIHLKCMGGCSAHRDNWYCPECDKEAKPNTVPNTLQKAAEILVACGYADAINSKKPMTIRVIIPIGDGYPLQQVIDPFADTLEGRKQADAIEDWFVEKEEDLWYKAGTSKGANFRRCRSMRLRRLDRIRWCLEQLADNAPNETAELTCPRCFAIEKVDLALHGHYECDHCLAMLSVEQEGGKYFAKLHPQQAGGCATGNCEE